MIFERAARREFAQAAAGISVALLAILTSTNLIRLLKEAAGGRIAPEAVASLLGFAALNFMPVLLSLTLFVAVLLSLSRMYRDSEMVVWFSSGLALTGWARPDQYVDLLLIHSDSSGSSAGWVFVLSGAGFGTRGGSLFG